MKRNNLEKGFSLIEILVVLVVIGILTALTVPFIIKAIGTAENRSAYGSMKTMLVAQTNFYSEKGRYARLNELNNSQYGGLGVTVTDTIEKGKFVFTMSPPSPSDSELKDGFVIIGTKRQYGSEPPTVIRINHQGYATTIY